MYYLSINVCEQKMIVFLHIDVSVTCFALLQGRAWIRMCLMEKRLADYVSVAVQASRLAE